ncbi:MAG: SpoIIE family protein phosphatase [Rhodospirillales bacterium]|nr:SpoIIE family protein phosphatase [Rhodospirillales bacterium]
MATIRGTKSGIGYRGIPHSQKFEEHKVSSLANKVAYMTSDGLVDQVGGKRRRMYGKKRFRELLINIKDLPMKEQKDRMVQALIEFQGDEIRRDDVSVIGFKV